MLGPRDMSIKALNAAIAIVQHELSHNAVLSTSFVPNGDSAKANRLRVSILAGMRAHAENVGSESPSRTYAERGFSLVAAASTVPVAAEPAKDVVDELLGAPDWLIDRPSKNVALPALL